MKFEIHLTNDEAIEAADGGEAALNRLAEAAGWQLLHMFLRAGLQKSDAEDLAQGALARAFGKLGAGVFQIPVQAPAASLMAWILQFGRWILLEHIRESMLTNRLQQELSWRMAQRDVTAETNSCGSEVCQIIEDVMMELSADDHLVISASHLWSMKDSEIAIMLDVSPAAARKRLSRARTRLRELLEKDARFQPHLTSRNRETQTETA